MALLVHEADVEKVLDMPSALRAIERAFVELGHGRATNQPRIRIHQKHGALNVMSAALPAMGVVGFKAYTWYTTGSKFIVHLYRSETGELLAIIEADRMGQIRTGAASGVATKFMARDDSKVAGVIGTGYQAESQLLAMCHVRKIDRVMAYSRGSEKCKAFCRKMEGQLKIEVRPMNSGTAVVEASDIVITATSAGEPLFDGDAVEPGAHLNIIGGNALIRSEIDSTTVQRAQRIAADSVAQAHLEAGEFLEPIERGLLAWEKIVELGSVVAGLVKGRESAEDITLFKSMGIALEDIAVGAVVYERALQEHLGEKIQI
ncbi:MAG: ornithine cyclodeaminase family protein [Acidobacteriia bacterium]|nr:ornithine cyclodeaminase family protein [Terriglobia bacterium]